MRATAILQRWIETLAEILVSLHERRRQQNAVTVALENQQVIVKEAPPSRDVTRPLYRPAQSLLADLRQPARKSFVIAEFPADKVVRRDITIPAGAQKFLSGVIRNQIERLSPWPPNNAVYGFSSEPNAENAAVVNVRILMASRTDIDAFRNDLAGLDVKVDRIVANSTAETAGPPPEPLTLWSRLADASREDVGRVGRLDRYSCWRDRCGECLHKPVGGRVGWRCSRRG